MQIETLGPYFQIECTENAILDIANKIDEIVTTVNALSSKVDTSEANALLDDLFPKKERELKFF